MLHALGVVVHDQVGGDLQLDEAVVGHVVVESGDDPVAVTVGVGVRLDAEGVRLVLGVAGDVEPVPAPALAVMRTGQHTIDDPGKGVRRMILQKRLDFLRSRRQPDQVEAGTADQLAFAGGLHWVQLLGFEASEDEVVDGVPRPGRILDLGQRGFARWQKRPELPAPGEVDLRGQDRLAVARVGAPISIHLTKSATTASANFFLGGIFKS